MRKKAAVHPYKSDNWLDICSYFDARLSQAIPDCLASLSASVRYFGGVPASVVPDNLKSAVISPSRYEPVIQASFAEWAEHYGTAWQYDSPAGAAFMG